MSSDPTENASASAQASKMGKGKEKGPEMLTDKESLAPWAVELDDAITTPLGTVVTVIGTKANKLWVRWPGGQECALASAAECTGGLEPEVRQLTCDPPSAETHEPMQPPFTPLLDPRSPRGAASVRIKHARIAGERH